MISGEFDVVVVGAGNAGMCAALAARGEGARVLVLEAAPFDERGGNSRYTAGALRFVYNGVEDLVKLCDLSETEIARNIQRINVRMTVILPPISAENSHPNPQRLPRSAFEDMCFRRRKLRLE